MRPIDADALYDRLAFKRMGSEQRNTYPGLESAISQLKKSPTIDAVPVVRCSECEHSRPVDRSKPPEKYYKDICVVCTCEDVVGDEPMIYPPNHFCSFAIRKEEPK